MNGVKYYWLTQNVAFIKRWPSYRVTTIVRFHCITYMYIGHRIFGFCEFSLHTEQVTP